MSDGIKYGVEISATGGERAGQEFQRLAEGQNKVTAATEQANKKAEDYVASLKKQADTLGMTSLQVKAYEGDLLKLTATQQQAAAASLLAIKGYEDQQKAIQDWTRYATIAATTAVALAGAFAYKVKTSIDAAAALQTLSEKTGIATERLAGLKYAADVSDTSIESLARAFQRLPKSLIEGSNPNSEAGRAFSFLGIDPSQLKTQEQAIDAIANAITRVQDPMAKSAALQMIFKRNGEELIPLFNQGAEGIRRLTEEGARWNNISGVSAQQAKELKDQLVTMQYASNAVAQRFASDLVPRLNNAAEAFLNSAREGNKFLGVLSGINAFFNGNDQQRADKAIVGATDEYLAAERDYQLASQRTDASGQRAAALAKQRMDAAFAAANQAVSARSSLTVTSSAAPAGPPITGSPSASTSTRTGRAGPVDDGQSLVMSLENQLSSLRGESTEVDKVIRTLTEGTKKYSIENQAAALAIAGEVDEIKQQRAAVASMIETLNLEAQSQGKADEALANFNSTVSDHIQALQQETQALGMTSGAKAEAVELQRLDNEYTKASLAIGQENIEQQEKLLNIYKQQRAALIDAVAQREQAKASAEARKVELEETKRMWSTVEQTGKTVFSILLAGGEDTFKSIGKAIKASVIDLLYQLTVRKFIINIGASITGAGAAGAAGAAGGGGSGGGLGSLMGGGGGMGGIADLAGSFTGGFDSLFQSAGVSMGSQFIADIGNSGFGMPVVGGLLQAASGNVAGGIGSTIGGIAGSYFGPVGTMVGSAIGSYLGSMIGGGGADHSTHGTAYRVAGSATIGSGFSGTTYGQSASDEASYEDPLADQATFNSRFSTQISTAFTEVQKLAKVMGLDASVLNGKSYSVNATGPENGGNTTQTFQNALGQITDQMATDLIPNIKDLQQANESLSQTFIRLADAARSATINDALTRMSVALKLSDQVQGLLVSDISPLTNQQKLDALSSQYTGTLAAARGGDLNAAASLGNVSQQYLKQARSFYASSTDYTGIFNQVQSDVGDFATDTLTDQSIKFSDMGISLDQIAANTQNLDVRIAKAIGAAIAASADANTAVVEAQTKAIVKALIDAGLQTAGSAFSPA